MRFGWMVVLSLLTVACAARPHASAGMAAQPTEDSGPESSLADPIELNAACMREWSELFAEWKRNGGGVKDSIVATRKQIALDRRSRLAEMVRRVWAAQPIDQARAYAEFGAWPLSEDAFIELNFRGLDVLESLPPDFGIQESCRSIDESDWLLWKELLVWTGPDEFQVRALKETPGNIEWTSPYASQWLYYWLFVRVEGL
jgi:hypothetical protein